MHTVTEMGTSVPAFLGKLWRLVEDPETDDLICWAPNGRSFFIRNQARFARELLPHYYKHNNMASFVRQLNMYGFHKKVSVELGGLKCDRDEMEFAHQYFCKDHPYLLDHIKRKIASNKTQDPSQQPIKPELMNKMLTEVRSMRGRQENFDSRLGVMKRENEALWRELALLRQKHLKQQQVVNKLIHFLVTLVNPNRSSGLGLKRRYPLMIDDANRQRLKQSKLSKVQHSPLGPAIHELDSSDPDLESDYIVAEMLDNEAIPTIESPEHSISDEHLKEYYTEDSVHLPQELEISQIANLSRKRIKGKKKGEETFLLEMPSTATKVQVIPATVAKQVTPNRVADSTTKSSSTVSPKPVPMATVRSSKLAAMAANIKKNTRPELDLDLESLQRDSASTDSRDDSIIKLENILIVPDIEENYNHEVEEHTGSTVPSSVSSMSSRASNHSPGNSGLNVGDHSPDVITEMNSGDFGKLDFMGATNNEMATSSSISSSHQKPSHSTTNRPQKDSQKNLSLSCVNQPSTNETNFRLDSMEEVDNHVGSMQSELDNLKEALRDNSHLSIDANTLLGVSRFDFNLFGTEDGMYPFGFPINQELDPHERDVDDDHHIHDPMGLHNKNELMTYNTGNNLLDFEDDIFLGASSSSPTAMVTDGNNRGLGSDALELGENKGNIFDSLIANNASQT